MCGSSISNFSQSVGRCCCCCSWLHYCCCLLPTTGKLAVVSVAATIALLPRFCSPVGLSATCQRLRTRTTLRILVLRLRTRTSTHTGCFVREGRSWACDSQEGSEKGTETCGWDGTTAATTPSPTRWRSWRIALGGRPRRGGQREVGALEGSVLMHRSCYECEIVRCCNLPSCIMVRL